MKCINCGTDLPDGCAFCINCGTRVPESSTKHFCTTCGTELPDAASPCPNCNKDRQPEPKKKPANKRLLSLVAAGLAAVILIVILLSSISSGPMVTIGTAIGKTFAKSFTVEFELSYENQSIEGSLQVDIDVKKQTIMVYGELESGGEELEIAIYDEHIIYSVNGDTYAEDISDNLEEYWENYENTTELNWDELFDLIEDNTGVDLSDVIDIDKMDKCTNTLIKNFNNKKWLAKNAGYTTEKSAGVTYYSFEPNVYDLLVASLSCYENAFEDKDDYDDMMDGLEDSEDELEDAEFELSFGIRGGKMVSMALNIESAFEIEVQFTDIGKTNINTKHLKNMLEDAE